MIQTLRNYRCLLAHCMVPKSLSLMSTLSGTNCSAPNKQTLKDKLPPCADCLYKHCQRASYQTAVWKRALDAEPEIPSPIGKGWIQDKGDATTLAIDWMEGLPAPDAVLELMSCSCTRACKAPQCKCIANGLHCTEMCRLTSCNNMQPDEEPETVVDNEDDFDYESDGEDERN